MVYTDVTINMIGLVAIYARYLAPNLETSAKEFDLDAMLELFVTNRTPRTKQNKSVKAGNV